MPLFLQTSRHSAESCPLHNEKVKKVFSSFNDKMGQLTKKHGIKVVGAWTSMPEHLIIVVYDVPNVKALTLGGKKEDSKARLWVDLDCSLTCTFVMNATTVSFTSLINPTFT